MINETAALSQITMTLARHFDSLYYVDMENDEYMALEPLKMVRGIDTYKKGVNFFEVSMKAAKEYVAPEDVEYLEEYQSKEKVKAVNGFVTMRSPFSERMTTFTICSKNYAILVATHRNSLQRITEP